jgi:hypothetical protein
MITGDFLRLLRLCAEGERYLSEIAEAESSAPDLRVIDSHDERSGRMRASAAGLPGSTAARSAPPAIEYSRAP